MKGKTRKRTRRSAEFEDLMRLGSADDARFEKW